MILPTIVIYIIVLLIPYSYINTLNRNINRNYMIFCYDSDNDSTNGSTDNNTLEFDNDKGIKHQ